MLSRWSSHSSLAMADFKDYRTLEKVGDNYYTGQNPVNNTNVTISQGSLETSNVNVTNEMVEMISSNEKFWNKSKDIELW